MMGTGKSGLRTITSFKVNERTYSAVVEGKGPTVLCLHGFPDTYHSFRHQIPALAANGYRVVCPYLPGYELTTLKPDNYYDLDYLAYEINALAKVISSEKVHVIGHDWGAIAAYAAVGKSPDLFRSLTALTIPYNMIHNTLMFRSPRQIAYSWYIAFFQLRGIAELALQRNNFQLIDKLYRDWSPNWSVPELQLTEVKQLFSEPRIKTAALGYYRALLAPSAKQLMNGTINVPSLLLRGEDDGCIYKGTWPLIKTASFKKGVSVKSVKAGHFLHIEKPDEVNPLLLAHLGLH